MIKPFNDLRWKEFIPYPIYEDNPEFEALYHKAWELVYSHVKHLEGMPNSPYMDEGFCDTQIWIWDSCFMSLFCKYAQKVFPSTQTLDNFYQVLYGNKRLPAVIPNGNEPEWTGAIEGKPFNVQVHIADNPPLFAWAEYENAMINGDKQYLVKLLYERKFLQKHYEWVENLRVEENLPGVANPTCLKNRGIGYVWEGGRSGMDNTPRGRESAPTKDERPNNPKLLWIDAICQQALSAKSISRLFELVGDIENVLVWQEKFQQKKDIVNKYYWDEKDAFYYDIIGDDLSFNKVQTIASFWTLTSGIADQEKAKLMSGHLQDENLFGGKVPFVSLARNDKDFSCKGKYWRGAVWLPTAYATLKGLVEYGLQEEARLNAIKLLNHMWKTYEEYTPHTIWECYSPERCQPATQTDDKTIVRSDFCGWSALGPISIFIEFVLGFYKIDAFNKVVYWSKPDGFKGKIGIKNLRFNSIITDIIFEKDTFKVVSNENYTLNLNGKSYSIEKGKNIFAL